MHSLTQYYNISNDLLALKVCDANFILATTKSVQCFVRFFFFFLLTQQTHSHTFLLFFPWVVDDN